MDYIVKETKIWIVKDCKDEEEAKRRVMYDSRIGLKERTIKVVHEDWLDGKVGKWVAFTQEGMPCILHGKVVKTLKTCVEIKCKNAERRWAGRNRIIGFYDDKQECYSIR